MMINIKYFRLVSYTTFTNSYFLIMKLQIISKLVKKQSSIQHLICKDAFSNRHSLQTKFPTSTLESQYLPTSNHNQNQKHMKSTKPINCKDLFEQFHQSCKIQYQKVAQPMPKIKRNLQRQLRQLKKSPIILPFKSDYEYTFKKNDSTANTGRNQPFVSEICPTERQQKNNIYYFNQKTKVRLRKFHSLMNMKRQQSIEKPQNSHQNVLQQVKVVRKILAQRNDLTTQHNFPKYYYNNPKKECLKTQKQQSVKRSLQYFNCPSSKNQIKTETTFSQEKQRLDKIRRQLNQVYQMKKLPSQFKLKLF